MTVCWLATSKVNKLSAFDLNLFRKRLDPSKSPRVRLQRLEKCLDLNLLLRMRLTQLQMLRQLTQRLPQMSNMLICTVWWIWCVCCDDYRFLTNDTCNALPCNLWHQVRDVPPRQVDWSRLQHSSRHANYTRGSAPRQNTDPYAPLCERGLAAVMVHEIACDILRQAEELHVAQQVQAGNSSKAQLRLWTWRCKYHPQTNTEFRCVGGYGRTRVRL